ncbi:interferon regulatory factor 3 isoform X2 [Lepisosteus oculatus]
MSQRPLILPWLVEQIDSRQYPGVCWTNQERTEFCIPWKHGLRQDSSEHDTLIFKAWAVASGSFREGVDRADPSVWKRNFRCALKAKRVEVVADHSNDSANPHKVYRLPGVQQRGPGSQDSAELGSDSQSQEVSPAGIQEHFSPDEQLAGLGFSHDQLPEAGAHFFYPQGVMSPPLNQSTLEECLEELNICGPQPDVARPVCSPFETPQAEQPAVCVGVGPELEQQQVEEFKAGMSRAMVDDRLATQFHVTVYFRGVKVREHEVTNPRGFRVVWTDPCAAVDPEGLELVSLPGPELLLDQGQARLTHRILEKLGAGLEVTVQGRGVRAARWGDTHAFWSLSRFDRSGQPREVPKERGEELYSMGEFIRGLIGFMEQKAESPAYSVWFCLGEKWPDPDQRPWEKKLIMLEVVLTSLQMLKMLAVQGGASSLQSESVDLQVSDNPSLLSHLYSLESMDFS